MSQPRPEQPAGPFADLDAWIGVPRLSGLALSPDGTRLVTAVSTLGADRTGFVSALWSVDPTGRAPAQRLTRSAKGESNAAFLPDGSVVFTSARPDPDVKEEEKPQSALWHLPAGGGEARVLATRPGGVTGLAVARDDGAVAVLSPTMPGASTAGDDARRRKQRRTKHVAAILHDSYPIRFWDHDLGPDQARLLAGRVPADPGAAHSPTPTAPGAGLGGLGADAALDAALDGARDDPASAPGVRDDQIPGRMALRDLTSAPGRALDEASLTVSPDGRTVATTWQVGVQGGRRTALALVDVADGERRLVLDDEAAEFSGPRFSPDSRRLAAVRETLTTATDAPRVQLVVLDLATGDLTVVAPDWELWPSRPQWTPDGRALVVTADEAGRSPIFRIDLAAGAAGQDVVTRLTGDHGAYTDVQVAPDGRSVYALRSAVDAPPAPVRVDATGPDADPVVLRSPAPALDLPGRLDEVSATAEDGTPLRAWLALPATASGADPAPLLLWVHGGPLGSWNAWSWRWNPWLMVARGYAVLLPDPALSTGYGQRMIERGWGRWGSEPYTDLMTITDAAVDRDDVDETRTACMGGSFGGYMANWIAGHTDRFAGIVTHASLWALDQFGPTTDAFHYWRREMTAEMAIANSPHRWVDEIRTPMLVVHGDKDYRVPVGEGLRLWAELAQRSEDDGSMPHRFLYFPDENHWVLGPQHAKVWYDTVFAFLEYTVHGKDWVTPDILL